MSGYYLGIDGGQSATIAVIGDQSGRVLGVGRGGPCNHVGAAEGRTKFVNAIGGCVGEACRAAGLDSSLIEFESVCAGFSGGPADKEVHLRELVRARATMVTTDALIALAGATAGAPGIITIAGTGSIAWGRNAERKVARAGGWGYIFGDEGGGFDLTRQALRAVLRHEEGWGPATSLREMLLEATGAADANDLLHRFYTTQFPRPQIASFSKLVDEAAKSGDPLARHILLNAAQQLATAASAVRTQLFEPRAPVEIAYVGGVFRSQILLDRFRLLVELEDGNRAIAPRYEPAAGALIEALSAAGLAPGLSDVPREKG
jgi:N-acetylglucosamine kinase-like BadF-type ATPase